MMNTMGAILTKAAVADFGIQWALYIVAYVLKTEKFYDLAGSATHLLLTYLSLEWGRTNFTRQIVQSRMVMLWAFRLGLYLFLRVMSEGKDVRFDKIKVSASKFLMAWTVQGVWVFMNLLPTLILNSKKEDKPLSARDYVGWSMWVLGFVIEVLADYQKTRFRNNPDNAGKFISSGLWSLSRHPNYFGEILLWSGLYISASSTMKGAEFLSVISPLFTVFLLTKVSGLPFLERSGMKRWGSDPAYLEYLKKTPVLVPFFG